MAQFAERAEDLVVASKLCAGLRSTAEGGAPNMKVVQLFKIYNFDVVQKFI